MMKLIKRAWYWIEEYHLTILIDNYSRAIEHLPKDKKHEVVLARERAETERTRVRGEYNATFRPGVRFTFKDA